MHVSRSLMLTAISALISSATAVHLFPRYSLEPVHIGSDLSARSVELVQEDEDVLVPREARRRRSRGGRRRVQDGSQSGPQRTISPVQAASSGTGRPNRASSTRTAGRRPQTPPRSRQNGPAGGARTRASSGMKALSKVNWASSIKGFTEGLAHVGNTGLDLMAKHAQVKAIKNGMGGGMSGVMDGGMDHGMQLGNYQGMEGEQGAYM